MPAIGHSSHTPPAGDGDRRVAWLLNHTTLREFEVPLLRSLGLEVYCPKRFPRNPDNRSASVSHEFDDSLSIPADELRTLNAFDFYSGDHPPEIRRILNERFRTVVVPYMFPLFTQALAYFHGRILLRTFDSTHPTYSYSSWAREVASPAFERQLARASDRFWFAQAYPHLKSIEPPLFQRRAVDLPLGLPERVTRNREAWTGSEAIDRPFTAEHAAEQWRRGFVDGILSTAVPDRPRSGCVAVLPLDASEAVGAECRQIADRLRGGQAFGRAAGSVRPRVGSLAPWEPATNAATAVPFAWNPIAAASLLYAQRLSGYAKPVPHPQAAVPDDGICDFMDCDAWIVVGDQCTTPVATVKPYAFRYVRLASAPPLSREAHRSTAITLHNAAAVLVDTEADREGLVRDYGLPPEWIVRLDQDATGECLWDTLKHMP
jgi:hypothetical protein